MKRSLVVVGCLGVAVLLAGLVSAITESTAVLGVTPAGIGLYLAIGIGLPQYLLYRTSGSSLQLGLATLAVAGAAIAVLVGLVRGSLHADWGTGFIVLLVYVVVGNLLGAGVREFRAGYRSGS
ncbi:hypothetical protein [Natrinema longum]|uniref:Uncharacterized protein n=1 Tax=Natrinema longum TaxID=370324 RepID=A0A8A2UBG0_9EURY|nr:hypothetical protein [Natrinema longum]MBZ6496259.1 hypothetical protein [Natrinema longum]QSW85822.1 hypothetical protein J0X27_03015 [Natrinema longum]